MRLGGFSFIAAMVAALHLAALGFALGPWQWEYLLVTAISGLTLWGVLPWLLPRRRRRTGLCVIAALALAVQQAAFWLWRAKLGGVWWALAQFAAIHLLIRLTFARLRQRRPSSFVWRDAMLKQGRPDPTHRT